MANWALIGDSTIVEGERIVAVCDTKEAANLIINLVNYDRDIKEAIGSSILDCEIKVGGSE